MLLGRLRKKPCRASEGGRAQGKGALEGATRCFLPVRPRAVAKRKRQKGLGSQASADPGPSAASRGSVLVAAVPIEEPATVAPPNITHRNIATTSVFCQYILHDILISHTAYTCYLSRPQRQDAGSDEASRPGPNSSQTKQYCTKALRIAITSSSGSR